MNLSKEQLALLTRFQKQEITGYKMYLRLAKRQKDEHNKKVLLNIASDEIKPMFVPSGVSTGHILP